MLALLRLLDLGSSWDSLVRLWPITPPGTYTRGASGVPGLTGLGLPGRAQVTLGNVTAADQNDDSMSHSIPLCNA